MIKNLKLYDRELLDLKQSFILIHSSISKITSGTVYSNTFLVKVCNELTKVFEDRNPEFSNFLKAICKNDAEKAIFGDTPEETREKLITSSRKELLEIITNYFNQPIAVYNSNIDDYNNKCDEYEADSREPDYRTSIKAPHPSDTPEIIQYMRNPQSIISKFYNSLKNIKKLIAANGIPSAPTMRGDPEKLKDALNPSISRDLPIGAKKVEDKKCYSTPHLAKAW